MYYKGDEFVKYLSNSHKFLSNFIKFKTTICIIA